MILKLPVRINLSCECNTVYILAARRLELHFLLLFYLENTYVKQCNKKARLKEHLTKKNILFKINQFYEFRKKLVVRVICETNNWRKNFLRKCFKLSQLFLFVLN